MNLDNSNKLENYLLFLENIISGIPFHFVISQMEGQLPVSTANCQLG